MVTPNVRWNEVVEEGFKGVQVKHFAGFTAGEEAADAIDGDLGGEVELGAGERGDRDPFDQGSILIGEDGSVHHEVSLRVSRIRCREVEFSAGPVEKQAPQPAGAEIAGEGGRVGEDGGEAVPTPAQLLVADRVDPAIQAMETARGHFASHGVTQEAEGLQLTDRDDAVLAGRDHRQPSALRADLLFLVSHTATRNNRCLVHPRQWGRLVLLAA